MPTPVARSISKGLGNDGAHQGKIVLVTAGDTRRLTGGYLYNRRIVASLREAGLPVVEVVLPVLDPRRARQSLHAILAWLRPALVIVDSIAIAAAAPLITRLNQELGSPVMALMHMLPSELAPSWQQQVTRHLECQLLSATDHTVAVSPCLRDRLIDVGAAPERVSVILPGRDGVPHVDRERPDPHLTRFLCVANWSPNKGLDELIEAISRVKAPWRLDLVGETGEQVYAGRLRQAIIRLKLSDRVWVHGPLEGPALAERYAAADVFALPSHAEGFGTVFAEAMTFGLPVIAYRVGPLPWLVREGCGLLVAPGDSAALAEALEQLAGSREIRRQMSAAALRRAQRLPTWRETGEAFARLVQDLLAGRSPVIRRSKY